MEAYEDLHTSKSSEHLRQNSHAFVILFFIVDHDNDVPVVHVLIFVCEYKGQLRFVMTGSQYKNNN